MKPQYPTLRANPYRLFFPLGILFGVLGVGEWVLWSIGWSMPAASLTHTSLQVQGFLSCFVMGFLLTAFPRFTGAEPAKISEIAAGFCLSVAFLAAILAKSFIIAEYIFIAFILTLLIFTAALFTDGVWFSACAHGNRADVGERHGRGEFKFLHNRPTDVAGGIFVVHGAGHHRAVSAIFDGVYRRTGLR
jgi:hypothetical protein